MNTVIADVIKSPPLLTAIAGVLGVCLGSLISWLNTSRVITNQDKKEAQVHFREYYILEGFENGLASLMLLKEHYIKAHPIGVSTVTHTVAFDLPITPFLRVYEVIGCKNVANVVLIFRSLGQGYVLARQENNTEIKLIDALFIEIERAKDIIVPYSNTSKPDIEKIRQIPEIVNIKSKIENIERDLQDIIQSYFGNGIL